MQTIHMQILKARLESGTAWRSLSERAPSPNPDMNPGWSFVYLMVHDCQVPEYWPTLGQMLDSIPFLPDVGDD